MPTRPRQPEQMYSKRCWNVMEPTMGMPTLTAVAAFLAAGHVCPLLLLKGPISLVLVM